MKRDYCGACESFNLGENDPPIVYTCTCHKVSETMQHYKNKINKTITINNSNGKKAYIISEE